MQNFCVLMSKKVSLIDSVAFEIFYVHFYSSYNPNSSVISVQNAFQAAIVLSSIQYLRLTVYAFGR